MKKAPHKDGAGKEYLNALNKLYSNTESSPNTQPLAKSRLKALIVAMGRKGLIPARLAQLLINHGGLRDE